MKPNHRRLILALLLAIATTLTLATIAPTQIPKPKPTLKIRWKPPIPPSTLGIPGNRAQGGGTRSGCHSDRGITALVPLSPQKIHWGQTISDRPTIWLNAPQGLTKDLPIEISVRSATGNPISKQLLTIAHNIPAGAVSITFPPDATLEVDRTYRWEVALYCDTNDRIDRPFVIQGQVKRIAPPPKLETAISTLNSVQILAENGIWYDAISTLGTQIRQNKDRQLATAWSDLLKAASVKGSNLVRDCCQFDLVGTPRSLKASTNFLVPLHKPKPPNVYLITSKQGLH